MFAHALAPSALLPTLRSGEQGALWRELKRQSVGVPKRALRGLFRSRRTSEAFKDSEGGHASETLGILDES